MLKKQTIQPVFIGIALTTLLACQSGAEVAQNNAEKDASQAAVKTALQAPVNDAMPLKAQAGQLIKQFAGQLQTELKGAIKSGGLEAGIKVCHSRAPQIANELSTNGWEIARTSLKARNEGNKPDEWEYAVLQDFDTRYQAGEAHTTLVATANEADSFRLMKAIPTGQLCLACHGSSVAPEVQASINAHYPNDQATGYTLNDLRGAFTLKKAL